MATVDAPHAEVSGFVTWLERASEDFALDVVLKLDHGRWYAVLLQFDITGAGGTRHEAVIDAYELLFAYLRAFYEDGVPFCAAVRPIPTSRRLRFEVESAVGHLVRLISNRLPISSESAFALPPGTLSSLARC